MPVYEFVTVDVFTDRRFGGNPLAVFPDARGLTSEQMQALAMEFNLSETTFVLPPDDPQHHAKVRIFTPRAELPFAGHPNVGTGYVLAKRDDNPPEHYVFEELAGLVRVHVLRSDNTISGARISAPRALSIDIGIPVDVIAACAGLDGARHRHQRARAAGRLGGHAVRHRRGGQRGGIVARQSGYRRVPCRGGAVPRSGVHGSRCCCMRGAMVSATRLAARMFAPLGGIIGGSGDWQCQCRAGRVADVAGAG